MKNYDSLTKEDGPLRVMGLENGYLKAMYMKNRNDYIFE
jgi:hypothetical protein